MWLLVKKVYNRLPRALRAVVLVPALLRLWGPTLVRELVTGSPLRKWKEYAKERGMSPWHDVVDWVGGYPFEVSTPAAVVAFYGARGFDVERLKTCGNGFGCNEYVLRRAR
jgi:2-polyprenyl-6-hydroxyphenyl methylase/3-demethylubiquinone-9 3-methyltransferase